MSGETVSKKMNARVNVTREKCSFTSVVGLPTPTVIDGGHVASNMVANKRTEHEELL